MHSWSSAGRLRFLPCGGPEGGCRGLAFRVRWRREFLIGECGCVSRGKPARSFLRRVLLLAGKGSLWR